MNEEYPQFVASNYASTVYSPSTLGKMSAGGSWVTTSPSFQQHPDLDLLGRSLQGKQIHQPMSTALSRRLVQVFICDPNENVPLDKCLLYTGDQKLTDLNDQELFFEIDIKSILEKHNLVRAKTVDKKVKERVEYLEPARIRDLKMIVTTVAQF